MAGRMEKASGVDARMLELLVCPLSKGPLTWDEARGELISKAARLAYPVRDGIPIMLPSEARSIDPGEVARPAGNPGRPELPKG